MNIKATKLSLILSLIMMNFHINVLSLPNGDFENEIMPLLCHRNLFDVPRVYDRFTKLQAISCDDDSDAFCYKKKIEDIVRNFCEINKELWIRDMPLIEVLARFFLRHKNSSFEVNYYLNWFNEFPPYIGIPLAYHILLGHRIFHDCYEGFDSAVGSFLLEFKLEIAKKLLNLQAVIASKQAQETIEYIVEKLKEKIKVRKAITIDQNRPDINHALLFCDPVFAAAYDGRDDILRELYNAGINFKGNFFFYDESCFKPYASVRGYLQVLKNVSPKALCDKKICCARCEIADCVLGGLGIPATSDEVID